MTLHTTLKQHPERAVPEKLHAILAEGLVAHVGFCQDGQPYVIPFSYHFDPQQPACVYLHGSTNSRALQWLAQGHPLCVDVTLLDGLVYSRTALYHSMNYRSVIGFGQAQPVTDADEKAAILEQMVQKYFPGRTAGRDYAAAPEEHLRATLLLRVTVTDWCAKSRADGPRGPHDQDGQAPGSAGVTDLRGGVSA